MRRERGQAGVLSGLPALEDQGRRMEFQYRSGDQPLEGFTIKRGLGWGGFGEVYYAISESGKEVALKLVRRHLDVELRGVSQCINLKSPNLIGIFDVKENKAGENWIIMEFVSGPSLQQHLARSEGPRPFDEVQFWLTGIANGVDYLHKNGIVHRDLKPGNIFRDDEFVKIGDYGLSKFISTSRRSGQTQSVGTVHYMAPEISTGNYGRSVDVYSTAIIAYEMLTGDVPFDGQTPGEVLMKHLTAAPELSRVDSAYRALFEKALAKAPDQRFGSAGELVQAIISVHKGEPIRPMPTVEASPPPPATNPSSLARETPVAYDALAETMAASPPMDQRLSIPPLPGTFSARRREWSTLLWSVFIGGLLSGILPAVAVTAYHALDGSFDPRLVDYISMSTMTGLISAGLLVLGFAWRAAGTEQAGRHMHALIFGLFVGGSWFAMNAWLLQTEPDVTANLSWSQWTDQRVLERLGPHLLGFLTISGLTFAIPDWMGSVNRQRKSRISVAMVVWPAAIGFAVASLIGEVDATMFAGVIGLAALVVQWVSPHESPIARRRRQRRQFAGR